MRDLVKETAGWGWLNDGAGSGWAGLGKESRWSWSTLGGGWHGVVGVAWGCDNVDGALWDILNIVLNWSWSGCRGWSSGGSSGWAWSHETVWTDSVAVWSNNLTTVGAVVLLGLWDDWGGSWSWCSLWGNGHVNCGGSNSNSYWSWAVPVGVLSWSLAVFALRSRWRVALGLLGWDLDVGISSGTLSWLRSGWNSDKASRSGGGLDSGGGLWGDLSNDGGGDIGSIIGDELGLQRTN